MAVISIQTKKMSELAAAEQVKNSDKLIIHDGNGMKVITFGELIGEKIEDICADNAGAHNAIYRGQYLGASITEEQYAAIAAGTFDDLYIGDYWTIGEVDYRIAAFDYYLNKGDTRCTDHHVVVVPDRILYSGTMNDSNSTDGGYNGSKMRSSGLSQAKNTINAAFSGHVLSHRVYLTNAVVGGHPTACAWVDSEVDLMCEQMVYGAPIFMPITDGSSIFSNYRLETSQLPLFAHDPRFIYAGGTWWLRDVASINCFANVATGGYADCASADLTRGVRPYFCIY